MYHPYKILSHIYSLAHSCIQQTTGLCHEIKVINIADLNTTVFQGLNKFQVILVTID